MENLFRRTARAVLAHSQWIPVAGAAVYLVLWIVAEAGRSPQDEKNVVFALFAIAIAASGFVPITSLAFILVIPSLQLVGGLYPPMATSWPMYAAAGFVALVIAFRGEGLVRKLVLPVGVVASILFAARMMLPSTEGYWTSWIGNASVISDYPHREHFTALCLAGLVFYVGMWALGLAARSLLRERAMGHVLTRTDFELRLADDRARISRDVHDALAHSLAVIVSQAEGALALQASRPAVTADALSNIASVGRVALTDVRSLVESIHDHDLTAIAPTIGDLGGLISRMRKVGMDATLQVLGTPRELQSSRDLAVFRIVQESLTNALKHAGSASTARVTLDWQGPGLAILVVSKSCGDAVVHNASPGVGIVGMKERARLTGGWLTAEHDGDDFLVTAFIPVQSAVTTSKLIDA